MTSKGDNPMHAIQFLIMAAGGAVVGGLVGWLTRPTLMGVPLPLGVLTSNAPMDAPFKAELTSHLMMSVGAGTLVGAILFAAIYMVMAQRRT